MSLLFRCALRSKRVSCDFWRMSSRSSPASTRPRCPLPGPTRGTVPGTRPRGLRREAQKLGQVRYQVKQIGMIANRPDSPRARIGRSHGDGRRQKAGARRQGTGALREVPPRATVQQTARPRGECPDRPRSRAAAPSSSCRRKRAVSLSMSIITWLTVPFRAFLCAVG